MRANSTHEKLGRSNTSRSEASNRSLVNSWTHHLPRASVRRSGSGVSRSDIQTIAVDVKRSSAHWDVHQSLKIAKRVKKRKLLVDLIETLAESIHGFRYYQGVHEICLVVLELTNGNVDAAFDVLHPLLVCHFGHFIRRDFNQSLVPMLSALEHLMQRLDPELALVLDSCGVGYYFAVPWILTWFAHSLNSFGSICSIFDFLIAWPRSHDRAMILYLCAAVTILNRKDILTNRDDMCSVFKAVQSSAENVDMGAAVHLAKRSVETYPSEELLNDCPFIRFLSDGPMISRITAQIVGRVAPLLLGVTLAGLSLVVASSTSADSFQSYWSSL